MPPHSDPIALFTAATDALERGDWSGMASLCDPVSLHAFRRSLLQRYERSTAPRPWTIEEYMRSSPDMPREVAEYQLAQQQRAAEEWVKGLTRDLPGVADTTALETLPAARVYAAWLEGRSARYQLSLHVAAGRISQEDAAAIAERYVGMHRYVPLGALPDGERVMHIVYRHGTSLEHGAPAEWLARRPPDEQQLIRDLTLSGHPKVCQCRRQPDGGWALIADEDFLGLSSTYFSVEPRHEGEDDDEDPDAGEDERGLSS